MMNPTPFVIFLLICCCPMFCFAQSNIVTANFGSPDTVCLNKPVQFENTSQNASNYFWSFCAANFNTTPAATNLGNPGNLLSTPVFIDYSLNDDGNYYGFVTNHLIGSIIRLNYGKSLLNTPTAEDLGNFGGVIPRQVEGLQVVHSNGSWYVIAVGGGNTYPNSSPRIIKLDFGVSLANTPVATNWGNIGNLDFPLDLYIAEENNNFYGFTININSSTITRFDFGSDLSNKPVGKNLGSIGNLNYPCGFSFINTNGKWYAFITNRNNNTISRLNFGNSLTNTPTGNNIGNPGNLLNKPRDISIFESCSGIIGLVVNEEDEQTGEITKLDFGNNLLTNPAASNLGNLGQLKFPHSISKFFLDGNDIYSFILNVNNNTITRLRYVGCKSSDIASSTLKTPPSVTYTKPGIYNVNLLVDIGLPTQTSFCKQIVVVDCDTVCKLKAGFSYQQNICDPYTVHFQDTTIGADSIKWDFGNGVTDTAKVVNVKFAALATYTVNLYAKTKAGCYDTATEIININVQEDSAIISRDTSICSGDSVQLKAIDGLNYCWSPKETLSDSAIQNPIAKPNVTTTYYLNILKTNNTSIILDSVTITVLSLLVINAGLDDSICKGSSAQLQASGAVQYNWNFSNALSDTTIANPVASPSSTTQFIVQGFDASGCKNIDTVKVTVWNLPLINLVADTAVCKQDSVMLVANVTGKNSYNWFPANGLSGTSIYNPVAAPADTTKYFVDITDSNKCVSRDSIIVYVLPRPVVSIMNDTSICFKDSLVLKTNVSNANSLRWKPGTTLNNAAIQNPLAYPLTTTEYYVTAGNGICNEEDSVLISVLSLPDVVVSNDTTICGNADVELNASGAVSYTWSPSTGLSDVSIADPIAAPGTTTKYFVKGKGSNACINTASVIITVSPAPAFSITPKNASICKGDSVSLTAAGGDEYSWLPVQFITNSVSSATKAFPVQSTTYSVTITNTICKVTNTLNADIVVNELPSVTVSKSNDIDCLFFESQLQATGGINYTWSPAAYIDNAHISNPIVNPPVNTQYFVTAIDANGCINKDSVLILSNTNNSDKAMFEIANAFTPNNDGINDCFSVRYWGPADFFDMSIYNRWGQKIYHSNNAANCWDGTFNGHPQPSGTYVYMITASTKCSNGVLHKKGTLVLIR